MIVALDSGRVVDVDDTDEADEVGCEAIAVVVSVAVGGFDGPPHPDTKTDRTMQSTTRAPRGFTRRLPYAHHSKCALSDVCLALVPIVDPW